MSSSPKYLIPGLRYTGHSEYTLLCQDKDTHTIDNTRIPGILIIRMELPIYCRNMYITVLMSGIPWILGIGLPTSEYFGILEIAHVT